MVDWREMTNLRNKLGNFLLDHVLIPGIHKVSNLSVQTEAKLKEKALKGEELLVTLISKGVLAGAYITYKGMHEVIHWWPTKRAASNFFEVGQFYRFLPTQIWYTVWENNPSAGDAGRVFFRMKPGSVFMVLSSTPDFPKGTAVHLICMEKVGWICVDGEAQYSPWNFFERVDYTKEPTVPPDDHDVLDEEVDLFL